MLLISDLEKQIIEIYKLHYHSQGLDDHRILVLPAGTDNFAIMNVLQELTLFHLFILFTIWREEWVDFVSFKDGIPGHLISST